MLAEHFHWTLDYIRNMDQDDYERVWLIVDAKNRAKNMSKAALTDGD